LGFKVFNFWVFVFFSIFSSVPEIQAAKTKTKKKNKTKQNKTKQNKTKQNKTKQNKTKQNKDQGTLQST